MLSFRSIVILSLALALIVSTVTASSSSKPSPNRACDDCFAKVNNCIKVCITSQRLIFSHPLDISVLTRSQDCKDSILTCQFNCNCAVARNDPLCRDSCDIGGPESGCSAD